MRARQPIDHVDQLRIRARRSVQVTDQFLALRDDRQRVVLIEIAHVERNPHAAGAQTLGVVGLAPRHSSATR
jgi:hypothetical protein